MYSGRTTKTSEKLVVLSDTVDSNELINFSLPPAEPNEAYRGRLTAFCSASGYDLDVLESLFSLGHECNIMDETLHVKPKFDTKSISDETSILTDTENPDLKKDLFIMEFGVIVCWGYTVDEEYDILRKIFPYEIRRLDLNDIQTEEFSWIIDRNGTESGIYNDVISLRQQASNVLQKLSISLAIAQSVKLTHFEALVDVAIEDLKHIPIEISNYGNHKMPRKECFQVIGRIFNLKSDVNLLSPILDTPEIFWSEPAFNSLYQSIRLYLEINQRTQIMNERVSIMGDMSDMLNNLLTKTHAESLEWIVIILVLASVIMAAFTITLKFVHFFGSESDKSFI